MSSGFNPRKPAERNADYQHHDVSGLSIAYRVKSGSHQDATVTIEGTRAKARLRISAHGHEQALLILQDEEIEALRDELSEVLER